MFFKSTPSTIMPLCVIFLFDDPNTYLLPLCHCLSVPLPYPNNFWDSPSIVVLLQIQYLLTFSNRLSLMFSVSLRVIWCEPTNTLYWHNYPRLPALVLSPWLTWMNYLWIARWQKHVQIIGDLIKQSVLIFQHLFSATSIRSIMSLSHVLHCGINSATDKLALSFVDTYALIDAMLNHQLHQHCSVHHAGVF